MLDEKQVIKTVIRDVYSIQKVRIQTGLRLVANFKAELGQAPSTEEEDLSSDAKEILEILRKDYKRISDAIAETGKKVKVFKDQYFIGTELISNEVEYTLTKVYLGLLEQEELSVSNVKKIVEKHPLWIHFLKDVKGIGPLMAGVLISEIDIHKAKYPSSLHAYAGIDVAHTDKGISGRGRKDEHLVMREYTAKDGTIKTKKSITYNPTLKTKLLGVICGGFIKCKSPYADVYNNYKVRLENRPDLKDTTKLHRHRMAVRYMAKIFLNDLYKNWRQIEGLVVEKPYHEAKLGIVHNSPSDQKV